MTQLGEAIARYHKLLETAYSKDLGWVDALREGMAARGLTVSGRPISPFLRPNFITRRQYANLVRAAEALFSAIARVKQITLSQPSLMARMELLPGEKMLAAVDPGYSQLSVTGLLDTHLENGSLRFVNYSCDAPTGVAYDEALADILYDCPPVRAFRKKHKLTKLGGARHLLQALLKAYKEFGGKRTPQIAILEFGQPFQTLESNEYQLLRDQFEKQGFKTEIVSPEQLEYKNGTLRKGDFTIDLIYRRLRVAEFLVRYDLTHPLVRAYRERAVCVVNSFRSELAQKRAIFDLLTDEALTSSFPAAERKAIREFIPWTRVVALAKTTFYEKTIDLGEFIVKNRPKLVLRPNDNSGELPVFEGGKLGDAAWERAIQAALRHPYVVQETVTPATAPFPVMQHSGIAMHEMRIDVLPHCYLGKVQSCSSWLSPANGQNFSSVAGLAPTFLLESKYHASRRRRRRGAGARQKYFQRRRRKLFSSIDWRPHSAVICGWDRRSPAYGQENPSHGHDAHQKAA